MAVKIEIPDKHVPALREFYKQKHAEYLEKAAALAAEWAEIEPVLLQLSLLQP